MAQRLGRVFASATTWAKLIRERGWRRPRRRVHPSRPKIGVRTTRPNEVWHIDTTIFRLLNGHKVYVQAIIDNFSRRILAWSINAKLEPAASAVLLVQAHQNIVSGESYPTLMVDAGIENLNSAVDALVKDKLLDRLVAQTEIKYSNSMIEVFGGLSKIIGAISTRWILWIQCGN